MKTRRDFLKLAGLGAAGVAVFPRLGKAAVPAFQGLEKSAARRPNILIILADDLGWADLGCYGADLHKTPNIDRLASESVRFTDAYAMSVCTPSRATLLTGRHAARVHMTIWSEGALDGPKNRKLLQADALSDLPHTETTVAKHLQAAGYLTALVGKWHLGGESFHPETHGFDVNIGGTQWGAPNTHFWPYSGDDYHKDGVRYVPHLEFGKPGEYLADRLTDEALRVMEQAAGQPFFLYLAHHAVHTPLEAKQEDVRHFQQKLRPEMQHQNAVYAAMLKNLDDNVGRVLAHLRKRGLDRNTIVIFTSDNGGYTGLDKVKTQQVPVTDNNPLRAGKGALYEGGIRVPLMIRWPGVGAQGAVCAEPVILTDLFQTCLSAAGLPPAVNATDGLDLAPLVKNPVAKLERDALFFHYPHYYNTTTPVGAIRARDWKLLEYFEDNHVELYNLRDDLAEQHNLARQFPEQAADLRQRLHAWRESVGAAMPKANPNFSGKT
jgi:arylsulfatase A-like enzyme